MSTRKPARSSSTSRGGRGGAEARAVIRRREEDVERLSTDGYSQREIADRVGVSQPGVSKILTRIDARWLAESGDRVAREKIRETRRLERIIGAALQAWTASKKGRTTRRQRKILDANGKMIGAIVEVTVVESAGDPRYLETARRATADLGRIWGTDVSVTDSIPAEFTLKLGDPQGRSEVATAKTVPPATTEEEPDER